MTEAVSFKAYLKREGQEVEVRRFGIDGGAASNFMYLRNKIQAMFPSIQNDHFRVSWQDSEKDYVAIGSDEELIVALTSVDHSTMPFKLFIHVDSQQQSTQGGTPNLSQVHGNVVCDSCDKRVVGFRYKCVSCPDFDLCGACEAAGNHSEHFMLRLPFPVASANCNPRVFRKFFGRAHKLQKFSHPKYQHHSFMSAPMPGHCPFSQTEAAAPSTAPKDMFDFSALLEFINSLAGASGDQTQPDNEPPATPQTSSKTQSTAGQQAPPRVPGADYLNGVGQAISTFLEPFGIDVSFDVRSPTRAEEPVVKSQGGGATAATTQQPSANTDATPSAPVQNTTSVSIPVQQATSAFPPQSVPVQQATSAFPPQSVPVQQATSAFPPQSVPVQQATSAFSLLSASAQQAIPATPPHSTTDATLPEKSAPAVEPQATSARRNSDDWTLINRESPTRSDAAMDLDEGQAGSSSVKPNPQAPADGERARMQEAINNIRSMGFDYETTLLRELLRRENGDIASVLESILNNSVKK